MGPTFATRQPGNRLSQWRSLQASWIIQQHTMFGADGSAGQDGSGGSSFREKHQNGQFNRLQPRISTVGDQGVTLGVTFGVRLSILFCTFCCNKG